MLDWPDKTKTETLLSSGSGSEELGASGEELGLGASPHAAKDNARKAEHKTSIFFMGLLLEMMIVQCVFSSKG